jgi:hypothetical protein
MTAEDDRASHPICVGRFGIPFFRDESAAPCEGSSVGVEWSIPRGQTLHRSPGEYRRSWRERRSHPTSSPGKGSLSAGASFAPLPERSSCVERVDGEQGCDVESGFEAERPGHFLILFVLSPVSGAFRPFPQLGHFPLGLP